jgi:hypothetical protein
MYPFGKALTVKKIVRGGSEWRWFRDVVVNDLWDGVKYLRFRVAQQIRIAIADHSNSASGSFVMMDTL